MKHDKYVDDLISELAPGYDIMMKHVPLYSGKKRLVGEVDIIGYKEGFCDIYEVKCSHRISKAKRQLDKFKKILSSGSNVRNKFFFCGESGLLMAI